MKLIECHISGFGAFRDYKLSFDDGLNVILQPNGWGKTTLTAYIKAMLYGFERKRVRDVNENERLRYKPWNGGKYGGTLDFECDGHEYRVLREFGDTPAGDTLRVIDIESGETVRFDGEEVGDWVFGLDSNAFQKSVFVGQNGFGFDGSTTGLRNRLNALVNEADDVAGLDKAQSALDARRKFYKKTGSRGYIADVSASMAKLVDRQKDYDSQIAQMGMLQDRMSQLDKDIADAAAREAELQKRIDVAQSGEKDVAALNAAHDQLVKGRQIATEAYRNYVEQVGEVPTEADLETARKAIDAADRFRKDIEEAQAKVDAAASAKDEIATKYAGVVPAKADIDARCEQLAELAHQLEVIGLSGPSTQNEFSGIDAAVMDDPGLLNRAAATVSAWSEVEAGLKAASVLRREIDSANAMWSERRANIAKIKEEADRAESLVPAGADGLVESYKKAASTLRESAKEIHSCDARMEGLNSQIKSIEKDLGDFENQPQASDSDLRKIDEGVASCKAASSSLSDAKKIASAEKSKQADLALAKAQQVEAVQSAQSAVAEAEMERARAVSAESSAKAAKAEAMQSKPKTPVPAIVCVALGVVAAVAGFIFGPVGTVSYAAYVAAVVLLVVGVVLFAKKPAGNSEILAQAEAAVKLAAESLASAERKVADANKSKRDAEANAAKAAAVLEAQELRAAEANETLEAAMKADAKTKSLLLNLLSTLMPSVDLDPETVVVQAPAFKERLAERAGKLQRLSGLKDAALSVKRSADQANASALEAAQAVGLVLGDDFSATADAALSKASEIEAGLVKVRASKERLDKAIAEAAGKTAVQITDGNRKTILDYLNSDVCPGMEERESRALKAEKAASDFHEMLRPLLCIFAVEHDNDTAVEVERLSSAIASYRSYKAEAAQAEAEMAESKALAENIAAGLESWAVGMGLSGREALTATLFDELSADAALVERLDWDAKTAAERVADSTASLEKLTLGINRFLSRYGYAEAAISAREALDDAGRRAKRCDELANAVTVANGQLSAWEGKYGQQLADAKKGSGNAQSSQMKMILSAVQSEREGLVAERAQTEEKRNSILQDLEGYLACAQEIRLLAQRKQEATSKLFAIQKTAEYLSQARANLDGRYLGGLTDRFNDYASSWLEGENLDVVVGGDFDVAVSDGGAPHSVASYSTGYQDLLDICLRMALVDTVFENEEPFIVMDDPFVNLDQAKINRAMLLLALLAQNKQIIYFTCHPSRVEGGNDATTAKFTLPEQKASREMPRARAKREAEERARAQAELVASYHVEPVTQGRASVQVADRCRSITNNMFNVRFEVDSNSGRRDNAFDVHFIDQKGRALCERQIVEVIDGHVVPERLRFCLTTREDSGAAFDLIIHEQEKPAADLAARITYKADISFSTEDFQF